MNAAEGPYPAQEPADAEMASSAERLVSRFVREWTARGETPDKALSAVSTAVMDVIRRNLVQDDVRLKGRIQGFVERGGLPPMEPEEDLLGGTDLDGMVL